ncbi:MAG: hypothetical protein K1X57_05680, partial [Gemmataceae bacterium]|nr:hypothetical protein [Gemmataceae bacterium]
MCLSTLTRWFRKVTENKFGTTWKFRQHMLAQSMSPLEDRVTPTVNLGLGDMVVTGYTSDDPDKVSILLLRDVDSGTQFTVTDEGWLAAQTGFRGTGEGETTFQINSFIPAGTQISLDFTAGTYSNGISAVAGGSDRPELSVGGDSILIYNGGFGNRPTTGSSTSWITGFQMNGIGVWDANAFDANTSARPTAFTDGVNSFAGFNPEIDNAVFKNFASVVGSPASIRSTVYNSANWTTNDTTPPTIPGTADFAVGTTFANDPFNTGATAANGEYVAGNLVTGSSPTLPGFTGNWFNSNNNSTVNATGLTYSGLATSGGRLDVNQTSRVGRVLGATYDNTSNTSFYARVLVNLPTNDATQYRAVEFYNSTGIGSDINRIFQLGQSSTDFGNNNWGLRLFNDNGFRVDLGAVSPGTTELFVIKFDFSTTNNADKVTVWRNPTGTGAEPTGGQSLTGFNITSMAQLTAANFGAATPAFGVDEIRFGNAWADVAVQGTTSAILSNGTLTLDDSGTNANNLSAKVVGTDLVFTDAAFGFAATSAGTLSNNGRTLTVPLAGITGKVVVNGGAGNDNFTLDWTGGAFTKNFDFAGGGGTDTF